MDRLEEIRRRIDFYTGIIGPVIDQEDAAYLLRRLEAAEALLSETGLLHHATKHPSKARIAWEQSKEEQDA